MLRITKESFRTKKIVAEKLNKILGGGGVNPPDPPTPKPPPV